MSAAIQKTPSLQITGRGDWQSMGDMEAIKHLH